MVFVFWFLSFCFFVFCCVVLCVVGCVGLRRLQLAICRLHRVVLRRTGGGAARQEPWTSRERPVKAPVGQPFPAPSRRDFCNKSRLSVTVLTGKGCKEWEPKGVSNCGGHIAYGVSAFTIWVRPGYVFADTTVRNILGLGVI